MFPCWTWCDDLGVLRYWLDKGASTLYWDAKNGIMFLRGIDFVTYTKDDHVVVIPESEALWRLMPKCVDCGANCLIDESPLRGGPYVCCGDDGGAHSVGPECDTPLKAILGYLRLRVEGINA